MGMFDSVFFKCPNCGSEIEEQSKAGICICRNYSPNEVPIEIALDLNETKTKCYECQSEFIMEIDGAFEIPKSYTMRLSPTKDKENLK